MAVSRARSVERSRWAWLWFPPAGPLLGLAFERRAGLPGPRRRVAHKRGAVAALRSAGVREARRDDHAAVLKVWSKRYGDLGRVRTQVACRLHQVLCELTPGGVRGEITAGQAARILASITPAGAVEAARCQLAADLVEDLRGVDARIRETRKKAGAAVRASGTSLTGLFGVGPVVA